MKNSVSTTTLRENFLLALLHRMIREYKSLWETIHKVKPFRIIEISKISKAPGETVFLIKLAHKNCTVKLTAAQIVTQGYNLQDFNDFHADLIRQAAQGRIMEFLGIEERQPENKITSKLYSQEHNRYLFRISNKENIQFIRTADEIAQNKDLLHSLSLEDVCDVCYIQGSVDRNK